MLWSFDNLEKQDFEVQLTNATLMNMLVKYFASVFEMSAFTNQKNRFLTQDMHLRIYWHCESIKETQNFAVILEQTL